MADSHDVRQESKPGKEQAAASVCYKASCATPFGQMTLASDGTALTGAWFDGQRHFGSTLDDDGCVEAELPVFGAARAWLARYFAGRDPGPVPPVRLIGTPFRLAVWQLLREIPYGGLTTYGRLARELSRRMCPRRVSARAVGGAVGHNPLSLFVPCHRVVGGGGHLTGYAGGLTLKRRLLEMEGVRMG